MLLFILCHSTKCLSYRLNVCTFAYECTYAFVYVITQSSSILWWIHTCPPPASRPPSPSLFVHLLAVLVFLLLELPEVGLDGGGSLLDFNGAERRNGGHGHGHGARPIAGIGVWARQDTGYSQRGRGNSHGDIVCSNDSSSSTRCTH